MKRRLVVAGTVAALAATVFLLGGALSPTHDARPAAPAAQTETLFPQRSFTHLPVGDTPRLVRVLQRMLRREPGDVRSLDQLGFAYEQRARETGDPSYYPKADGILHRALSLSPGEPNALSGLASLALSRHRFEEALVLGRQALRKAPHAGVDLGIVGDALLELGRYPEAFRTFDRMVKTDPGLPAYARISYARELLGRPRAAIPMMRAAVESSGYQPEPFAWSSVQLGKLFWSMGRIDDARREYERALAFFPGYVYALDALAQVEAADGRLARAIALERRAVNRTPLPQFVSALGDLLAAERPERGGAAPVRADGRHRPALARERGQDRPRARALPGRPRHPGARSPRPGTHRIPRPAEHRRRGRARLGAHAERPLHGGAAALEARAPPRYA